MVEGVLSTATKLGDRGHGHTLESKSSRARLIRIDCFFCSQNLATTRRNWESPQPAVLLTARNGCVYHAPSTVSKRSRAPLHFGFVAERSRISLKTVRTGYPARFSKQLKSLPSLFVVENIFSSFVYKSNAFRI